MKISGNEIKTGNIIKHKDRLWVVTKTMHTQPGKGGAYLQAEMKDIISGTKLNERFRAAEAVEKVRLDQQKYQFLFEEGEQITLMEPESYEQIVVDKSLCGDAGVFLQDGMIVEVESHEGAVLSITLPEHVTLRIDEADAVVKGQTASSSYKPAILENGVRIMVPPFIESGTRVVVNTTDSTYVERAKD